jgi:hypothetical protein
MLRLTLLAASAAFFMGSAQAQMVCSKRADLLSNLKSQFAEAPVAIGLANTGGVVEVLASPGGATWTIIVTDPEGVSCLMAAGAYWESIQSAPQKAKWNVP